MINQQVLEGNWNEIKGKLRSRWGQLSNDDVQHFEGSVDQLVGLIQRKTGERREAVEQFLDQLAGDASSVMNEAVSMAGDYAQRASERIRSGTRQAADAFRQQYEDAQEMVRQRPSESALFCFGAGVLAGLVAALLLRRK